MDVPAAVYYWCPAMSRPIAGSIPDRDRRCDSIAARGAILCLETKVGVGSFENAFTGAAKASDWRNLHRILPRSGEFFENESRETSIPRLETVEINQEIHLWEECF